ncbi:MAG: hypothetical protein QGG90_12375, partial [Nitrospinota bacterium]|nr:hypothetical protein [Nitrospinota bacterium]
MDPGAPAQGLGAVSRNQVGRRRAAGHPLSALRCRPPSGHRRPAGPREGENPLSISTRRGDAGETNLLYGGRVAKHHPRVEAYGALHEAVAALGLARAGLPPGGLREDVLR